MNFLLHHHFAAIETIGAPHAELVAIGAMLPDLFRMAVGRRRRGGANLVTSPESSEQGRALLDGCEHHASIDRWFHACAPFTVGERDLRRAFLLPESPKLVLFAHAAWEMCLDGAWLRQARASEIATVRRASKAAPFAVEVAAREGVTTGLDEDGHQRFATRMQRIFDAFADGTIYADYESAEGIARRLLGIRSAFGLGVPSPSVFSEWTGALEPFVDRADAALRELLDARTASTR